MILHVPLDTILTVINTSSDSEGKNIIEKIASLQTAGPQDLAVFLDRGDASVFDSVSIEEVRKTKAGFILASRPVVEGKRYLLVSDPLVAYQKLVDFALHVQKIPDDFQLTSSHALVSRQAQVHESVIVSPGALICAGTVIGEGTFIGAQVHLGRQVVIGRQVYLHPGVIILDRCTIDDGSIIHAGSVVGSDGFGYEISKQGLRKIPQIGVVKIGKMVEIGANCTIDRASFDQTVIGDGVKLDNMVHVAHNVVIGQGTAVLAQTGIAGSTTIGAGCQIGGQVAIKNGLTIGNYVKIVSKSAVMHNLQDKETVCGIPAIPFMQWKRISVLIGRLPEFVKLITNMQDKIHQPFLKWVKRMKGFLSRRG
jgi:UDP-3-O-[3-hydroxymyristoyl] glucosamine N-acyltransferase